MFLSCSLNVSIVGSFTIRQKRIRCRGTFVERNSDDVREGGSGSGGRGGLMKGTSEEGT